MFQLSKTYRFEASHQLMDHKGKCGQLHGHSWVVTVSFVSPYLMDKGSSRNMVVDFGAISAFMKPLIETFDHVHLNDRVRSDMPTSELIAQFMYDVVDDALSAAKAKNLEANSLEFVPAYVQLLEVAIEETCTSRCVYREGGTSASSQSPITTK